MLEIWNFEGDHQASLNKDISISHQMLDLNVKNQFTESNNGEHSPMNVFWKVAAFIFNWDFRIFLPFKDLLSLYLSVSTYIC